MRELNARTDIGGSRWSVDGLRDLITVQLACMTHHPAWTTLRQNTHPLNTIDFKINDPEVQRWMTLPSAQPAKSSTVTVPLLRLLM